METSNQPIGQIRSRRRSPFRSLLGLLLLSGVLLVFIAGLGDWRRRHNIEALLTNQAQKFATRTNGAGLLPLNLKPDDPVDPKSRLFEGWLSSDEALALRNQKGAEVMVAWTAPLLRVLGRDERAVIVFRDGVFQVRWMSLSTFQEQKDRQQISGRPATP